MKSIELKQSRKKSKVDIRRSEIAKLGSYYANKAKKGTNEQNLIFNVEESGLIRMPI
jgi:hypothetical protein